ncbi:TIGR03111 family XrtG-associated glycosyltransferase [Levilactobacillus tongjiangensis]|uniref:TIGR03111 family XrtG-associated glycosyltransferase n=1 Tax=Levilactobacillus tongjiangensis TaxID=2486023 RepID=A0ABW1SQA4_9LACO|nr:TIGR03111 family XrtG-associated glycosyltransferase [Levilactobacillus tongjiangensis]
MDYFVNLTLFQMGFWITWAMIPIVVEIIPSLISAVRLIIRSRHQHDLPLPAKLPFISIIVPVYNSEDTLFACLQSINDSTFPNKNMQIVIADNQSTDDSFQAFATAQNHFDLNLQLIRTEQGKAKALNGAIYQCIGTYIVNIDSDGVLEKHALMNMVLQFENDLELAAMTGTILPQRALIKRTKKRRLRLLQKNEYFEYAQAFLSGRTIESNNNELFTMSGAFSAFRKDTLLATFMYNTSTVGEDTDMTFQVRERLKRKVMLCADAIFYIEPTPGMSQLYKQRQRWMRGELEVSREYMHHDAQLGKFFHNFLVRRIMIDHTFIFPKMIWLFASVVLLFFRYSPVVLGLSYLVIYLLYVLVSLVNFVSVGKLLQEFPDEKHFYRRVSWVIWTLPIYNFVISWIRLVGIINSMSMPGAWNTATFGAETKSVGRVLKGDVQRLRDQRQKKE